MKKIGETVKLLSAYEPNLALLDIIIDLPLRDIFAKRTLALVRNGDIQTGLYIEHNSM